MNNLTDYERSVLRMLNGEVDLPWGAWVGAVLERLADSGHVTRSLPYRITDAGRKALEADDGGR